MGQAIKVSDSYALGSISITAAPKAKPVEVSTNHIVLIDCSGSMSYDLPKVREQLKKKLPKLIGPKDTISIIWFSGRGQCGVLLEAEPVATLTDLSMVNSAIDRWLNPIGMTGFKEPLKLAADLIGKIKKSRPGTVFSLFFMSDGCDNQWPRHEILTTAEEVAGGLSSATFVEYGYYADRPLLTQMAEKCGGQLVFATGFDQYNPVFEASLSKRVSGAPKVEVSISEIPVNGFLFTLADGDLITYAVENGKANVPEDTKEAWFLFETKHPYNDKLDNTVTGNVIAAAYAAVSLYSVRMNSDVVFALLKALGDVDFIERFATCFGKQKYSEYMDSAKAAAFDAKLRYTKGYDPKKVPAEDAFTILDLLRLLASDEKNHVLMEHPDFKYARIGRTRTDTADLLSPEEQAEIDQINQKLSTEKRLGEVKKLNERLAAILDSKQGALKFTTDPAPYGYPISTLTYNEDRPNISILVRKTGTVDLTGRIPAEHSKVPTAFPTFIWRNYAIIKDGLTNVEVLPVRVTEETAKQLSELLPPEAKPTNISMAGGFVTGVINLKALPVINRKMVASVSAEALFRLQYELEKIKAAQKVYKEYLNSRFPKKSDAKAQELYGVEATKWLETQGFGYNGFAPLHTKTDAAVDVYMGKELKVELAGMKGSLPKVSDVQSRLASSKKQTSLGALMAPTVTEVETYLQSEQYVDATDKDAEFKKWIEKKADDSIKKARSLMNQMAQIKFSVIVGQVWFKEFSSLDENTLKVTCDGCEIEGRVEMKEVEIKI